MQSSKFGTAGSSARFFAVFTILVAILSCQSGFAQNSPRRSNYVLASNFFDTLPLRDRVELHVLLIATGDFNAIISDRFGNRLYDAIVSFQRSQGISENGYATSDLLERLRRVGGPVLANWGLQFVDHPVAPAQLPVPSKMGLVRTVTRRGLSFERSDRALSLDFTFMPTQDASLAELYSRLSGSSPNRRVEYRFFRSSFFTVSGWDDGRIFYSRYTAIDGGSIGFTLAWNTDLFPAGNRLAIALANGLQQRGVSNGNYAMYLPQLTPTAPVTPLQPATPPPPVDTARPVQQTPMVKTGTGFFVTVDGDILTNHHVVRDCPEVAVVGHGKASIKGYDTKNDLALIKLEKKPEFAIAKPVKFRSGTPQLGEQVFVLGFPYAGVLDNGVNFTAGLVSSVSGMDNDSTQFQMTAQVQPGNSGGPVLDQSGNLTGVVVARMADLPAIKRTGSIPQNVNFGIKGEVALIFLRANGIVPGMDAGTVAMPSTEIASVGKAATVQLVCTTQ